MKPRSKLIWGVVLVALGMIMLGESTGWFRIDQLFETLIPLALIILGVWLITRRKRAKQAEETNHYGGPPPPPPPPPQSSYSYTPPPAEPSPDTPETSEPGPDESYSSSSYEETQAPQAPKADETGNLKYSKTFGDMFIDLSGIKIQNVEVSAGIGDLEIRLAGSELIEGLSRLIISSFIGDIRIFAPADMPVFAHCSNFVGDIEVMGRRSSGFGNSIDSQTANYQGSQKKLYVACNSFIGDIKILGL